MVAYCTRNGLPQSAASQARSIDAILALMTTRGS